MAAGSFQADNIRPLARRPRSCVRVPAGEEGGETGLGRVTATAASAARAERVGETTRRATVECLSERRRMSFSKQQPVALESPTFGVCAGQLGLAFMANERRA